MEEQSAINFPGLKLFERYELSIVEVRDPALRQVIHLEPRLTVKNHGRNMGGQKKVHLVERFINKIQVAGHRGKKHKIELGKSSGKYTMFLNIVFDVFDMLETQTKQNPVQVLVRAIENSAPRDEITVIEYGGARYPQAVDMSPLRRLNVALRNIVHGGSDRAFNKKKNLAQGLTEEIKLAAENNGESTAIRKKNESEKQADSAR
jgi:small subunit ribosomal protein S7